MTHILLVEDDFNLGSSLRGLLKSHGYKVTLVSELSQARRSYTGVDLILLDWRLPDGDGVDFVRELRFNNRKLPVILLTAKVETIDKVSGLESGANDYITKPFDLSELLARIRVQLRESNLADSQNINKIVHGILTIDVEGRGVSLEDSPIEMTRLEFDLLKLLAEKPGRVFSRDEILNKVWGYENFPTTRTVDTHILQLRQKLGDQYFCTLRGVGYKFVC